MSATATAGRGSFAARLKRWTEWRDRVDWKYNADTGGTIQMAELDVTAPNAAFATCYRAALGWVIRRFIRQLPIDPAQFTFVDLGSGKGRALLVAAEFDFSSVVGVEFCAALHETALANIAHLPAARRAGGRVRSVLGDATEFPLPQTDLVCFLYNPFGPPVIDAVAERLAAHCDAGFRVFVIYINPRHRDVFERAGRFETIYEHNKGVIFRAIANDAAAKN